MTTTDPYGATPPPFTSPDAPIGAGTLRRSRTQRVGAGVAGGLGEYFGLDPVLFRVLFATAAFFGGAGILAYLLAWAAIPEAGTEHAAVDRWIRELRRRRVPFWVVAVLAGLFIWVIAFSWWAPGPFFPVLAVVVLLAVAVTRSSRKGESAAPPVSLNKTERVADSTTSSDWLRETRTWIDESKRARRERMRRALPIKIATLTTLGVALLVLGLVDGLRGIVIPLYFWVSLCIVGVGLLVGMAFRRTPWSLLALLVPAILGTVAFAGSQARLHDGVGDREWKPTAAPAAHYRLAFGQGVLDLRQLPALDRPRTVRIDLGAGQIRILAPKTMNLTVDANVHIGSVQVDHRSYPVREFDTDGGFNYNRTIDPPSGATGQPITVDVHVADGNIDVERY
jgi:phage shock protein PspC (stress-responsive transcriptional regulator)